MTEEPLTPDFLADLSKRVTIAAYRTLRACNLCDPNVSMRAVIQSLTDACRSAREEISIINSEYRGREGYNYNSFALADSVCTAFGWCLENYDWTDYDLSLFPAHSHRGQTLKALIYASHIMHHAGEIAALTEDPCYDSSLGFYNSDEAIGALSVFKEHVAV